MREKYIKLNTGGEKKDITIKGSFHMSRGIVSTTQAWLYFWCLGVYLPEPKHALLPPFHSLFFSTAEQLRS